MTRGTTKYCCNTCYKPDCLLQCRECSKKFCEIHSTDHLDKVRKELYEVATARSLLQQKLIEQITQSRNHPLIHKIDNWERDSIKKIQRTAEDARKELFRHTTEHMTIAKQ